MTGLGGGSGRGGLVAKNHIGEGCVFAWAGADEGELVEGVQDRQSHCNPIRWGLEKFVVPADDCHVVQQLPQEE
jgi:hypothetical protein